MPSSLQSRVLAVMMFALVLAALLIGPKAQAQLHWQDENGERAAPALSTEYFSQVHGLIAETRIVQRFSNDSDQWLEGSYRLPVPEDAAVHGLSLRIGERQIEGEIRLREEARVDYEAAKAEGRRTALVENLQGNLFRTRVAQVGPGERVEVEVRLNHAVRFVDGRFELSLPLSLVPRYGEAPDLDGAFSAMQVATEVGAAPKALVNLIIDSGVRSQLPTSTSHSLRVSGGGSRFEVSSGGEPISADRDFVVSWTPLPEAAPTAALFGQSTDDADYALLMLVPPSKAGPRLPRELILILDTSGSMEGTSLLAAKAAARLALNGLSDDDRFNMIRFSSDFQSLFAHSMMPTASHLAEAISFIESLRADGGTEMMPALAAAFGMPADAERVRQVVFVTDGAVSNEDQISALVGQQAGQARLFSVGIGPAPNAHFLRKAAELGRGSALMVREPEEAEVRMGELLHKLDSPVLTGLTMHSDVAIQTLPEVLPDLYAGEALLIAVKGATPGAKLGVDGVIQGATWKRELRVAARDDEGIGRYFGRRLIDSLEDALRLGATEEQIRPQIEQVALHFALASRYTSLVAVDRTPLREADGKLRSVEFANALAPELTGFANTANDWPTRLLMGLSLCLLALLGRVLCLRPF